MWHQAERKSDKSVQTRRAPIGTYLADVSLHPNVVTPIWQTLCIVFWVCLNWWWNEEKWGSAFLCFPLSACALSTVRGSQLKGDSRSLTEEQPVGREDSLACGDRVYILLLGSWNVSSTLCLAVEEAVTVSSRGPSRYSILSQQSSDIKSENTPTIQINEYEPHINPPMSYLPDYARLRTANNEALIGVIHGQYFPREILDHQLIKQL